MPPSRYSSSSRSSLIVSLVLETVRGMDLILQYRTGFFGLATSLISVHDFIVAVLPVQMSES